MTYDHLLSPIEWVPGTTLNFISAMIGLSILINEIRRRRKTKRTLPFITKSLKMSSMSCITSGFLTNLQTFVSVFHGFCHFSAFLGNFTFAIHLVSMGSYQLFRLWHCHSVNNIHSNNKGYPKWLFIVMIVIGRLIIINWPLTLIFSDKQTILKAQCGLNHNHEYYANSADPMFENGEPIWIWSLMTGLVYLLWHLFTLALYAYKIREFHFEPIIYKAQLTLLYRIFILTLFYEIVSFIAIIIIAVLATSSSNKAVRNAMMSLFFNFSIISVSFSMHLMMDHNRKLYIKFLRLIYYLKLHHLCCKYKFIVTDQLNEADVDVEKLGLSIEVSGTGTNVVSKSSKKGNKSVETSEWATISQNDDTLSPPATEIELSVISDGHHTEITTSIE